MLNLKRIFKNYEEAGSLNAMVNLFGFVGPQVFLTKCGEVGVVLELQGVDYECLDAPTVDGLTKRLESAVRLFDENYRVYQLLFKRNRQDIPHSFCGKPVVDAAIRDRIAYFAGKADELFSVSIFFIVLCPALTARRSIGAAILEFPEHPGKTFADLQARFSGNASIRLDAREITRAESVVCQKAEDFRAHVSDFVRVRILGKDEAFNVLKRTLNFDPLKLQAAKLKHDTFLDYYLVESHLECHRGHLRVGDDYVKVLTLKEPSAHTLSQGKGTERLIVLTRKAKRLVLQSGRLPEGQAIYQGLVKPREAKHDAALYRLYRRKSTRIESTGGRPVRVSLDYELKRDLHRELAQLGDAGQTREARERIAEDQGLALINDKVQIPDLRLEYETADHERKHIDLELATRNYRPRALAQKAKAGFSIYAPREDASKLRRILDETELTARIFSL